MAKNRYNAAEREKVRQDFRLENGVYKFDVENKEWKPNYTVDTPPTTVSGRIHMGHTLSYTQAEVMVRYKRMTWHNVYYPFGTDTNGLPTIALIEKEIKQRCSTMSRKEFTDIAMRLIDKYIDQYKTFWKSLGYSNDWEQWYTTIEPMVQRIAQERFIELAKKNKVFRKKAPALWSTTYQTSIAQAEVENKEFDSIFYDLKFEIKWGKQLDIATTRPELLPACVAVFVHPDDEKYKNLVWTIVITPLWTEVKIMTDDKVLMDKWTGAVMCCTYGDEDDMYWVKKNNLEEKVIVNKYGKIEWSGIEQLEWLKVKQARKVIVDEILKPGGFVLAEKPIKHDVWTHERDGSPIEIISVDQRFVNILPLKEQIIEKWEQMKRYPDFMFKRFKDRADNLSRDRCITRNKPFGISIPVRYSKKTWEIILPDLDQLPCDPTTTLPKTMPAGHTADDLIAEKDVFDTRFTSWLTPYINYRSLKERHNYQWSQEDFLPMSMRPQAHDIIRTWDFYTVIHSMLHENNIPFHEVLVSGHVLAKKGEKISKSKWNAQFTPEQMIEKFGADAVRYWACSGQHGKDMIFDETWLKDGQRLVTKIRNAFNFVKIQLEDFDIKTSKEAFFTDLYPTDKRLYTRLTKTTKKMTDYLEKSEYGLAKIVFEEFFRGDLCDTYLEMVKVRLYKPELFEDGEKKKISWQNTLFDVFYQVLQLIAPYMPHITEELYQDYYKSTFGELSIHLSNYPDADGICPLKEDALESIDQGFEVIKKIIEKVRSYKTENKISLWAELAQLVITGSQEEIEIVKSYEDDVKGISKAVEVEYKEGEFGVEIVE